MVVVAVIVLVASAVVPMVTGTLMANRITSAGENLSAQLSLARQLAVSGNQTVEVRFYEYPDPDAPGSVLAFRAVALVRAGSNFTAIASNNNLGQQLGETFFLPSGIVISSASKLSPPLNRLVSVIDREILIKKYGAKDYRAFRIYPDGSTDLGLQGLVANQSYFTVCEEKRGAQQTDTPKNFTAVQVEPDTCRIVTYRP